MFSKITKNQVNEDLEILKKDKNQIDLPVDLLEYIFSYLQLHEILKFAQSNRFYYGLVEKSIIWKELLHKRIPRSKEVVTFNFKHVYLQSIFKFRKGLKISVLGYGNSGKSALSLRYVYKQFICDYDPTIEDIYEKITNINGEKWKYQIYDTSDQTEIGDGYRKEYMEYGDAYLLLFDITYQDSFQYAQGFYEKLLEFHKEKPFPLMLIGTKFDLDGQRNVTKEEALEYAKTIGKRYEETSAKDDYNISQVFQAILEEFQSIFFNDQVLKFLQDGGCFKDESKVEKKKCVLM